MIRRLVVLLATIGSLSCDSLFGSDCAGVGLARLRPTDTTIHVGESFVIRYDEGGTCGPVRESDYHAVRLTWTTTDSLVVRLAPATAQVTGLGVGDAKLTALEQGLPVTVHVK
ncbi:MAG TPA: hypothetical protein VK636_19130 [Gemmatimonadaceae bacterium]|nr:hypothetical protein [Gemmatimonadaceae bacterium]